MIGEREYVVSRLICAGEIVRRALIYGGCHAGVIRDMLEAIAAPDSWTFTVLINFQLIASGQPFPFSDLSHYDAIIYSPIENKGSYNTPALRAHCKDVGCQTICFPWLEWHGYCPGGQKGLFKGRHQWFYPSLSDLAAGFSTFDCFVARVIDAFPDDETIDITLEQSTARIRASEGRHSTDIKVADFIVDNFRSSRLFLISDHPALALYRHIIDQIVDLLGLETLLPLPSFSEPQWHYRTPILPRVSRRLDLGFEDGRWTDFEVLPDTSWDLQSYLALYYYSDCVIMGPTEGAEILDRARIPEEARFVNGTTRLLARPLETSRDEMVDYELLQDLPGPPVPLAAGKRFCIKPKEWKTSWLS